MNEKKIKKNPQSEQNLCKASSSSSSAPISEHSRLHKLTPLWTILRTHPRCVKTNVVGPKVELYCTEPCPPWSTCPASPIRWRTIDGCSKNAPVVLWWVGSRKMSEQTKSSLCVRLCKAYICLNTETDLQRATYVLSCQHHVIIIFAVIGDIEVWRYIVNTYWFMMSDVFISCTPICDDFAYCGCLTCNFAVESPTSLTRTLMFFTVPVSVCYLRNVIVSVNVVEVEFSYLYRISICISLNQKSVLLTYLIAYIACFSSEVIKMLMF